MAPQRPRRRVAGEERPGERLTSWHPQNQALVSCVLIRQVGEGAELPAVWPQKGQQPISYEHFSVALRSQDQVCLSNEDLLVVHTYVLESTTVR